MQGDSYTNTQDTEELLPRAPMNPASCGQAAKPHRSSAFVRAAKNARHEITNDQDLVGICGRGTVSAIPASLGRRWLTGSELPGVDGECGLSDQQIHGPTYRRAPVARRSAYSAPGRVEGTSRLPFMADTVIPPFSGRQTPFLDQHQASGAWIRHPQTLPNQR